MKVDSSLETPDGSVKFKGELNSAEVDLIISVGLNALLLAGALPMKVTKADDTITVAPGSGVQQ